MLQQWLQQSNYTVVFSGAGLSTESGLPDFRSKASGLWNGRDPLTLASVDAMEEERSSFIDFYRWRIAQLDGVEPHEGYTILAKWQQRGLIQSFITQNVDGLHEMAGHERVAHLHGKLRQCHCQRCQRIYEMERFLTDDLTCVCGGFIRPSIVLFGEALPQAAFEQAEAEVEKAELFIVLGSSLAVAPANFLPRLARRNGAKVVIINWDRTLQDADLHIHQRKIGDVLAEIDDDL